jgi:hypothetical protein
MTTGKSSIVANGEAYVNAWEQYDVGACDQW